MTLTLLSHRYGVDVGASRLAWVVLAMATSSRPALAIETGHRVSQYVHEAWTASRNGVPVGTILSLAQTPDGYLWLGTEAEGIYRFDGVQFTRDEAFDRLFDRRGHRINRLVTDDTGALWAATQGGVARLVAGRWTMGPRDYDAVGLAFADDGEVLIAARDAGLVRWREGASRTHTVGEAIYAVVGGGPGEIWVAGVSGLWAIRGGQTVRPSVAEGTADISHIRTMHRGSGGDVWVGARNGLFRIRAGKRIERYTQAEGLPDDDVRAVFEDREGAVWIGTYGHGLARLAGGRVERFSVADGLVNPSVRDFFQDREGSLWVATRGGLSRFKSGPFAAWGKAEGLPHDRVVSMLEGRDGSLWLWSDGGGLSLIRDGAIRTYTTRDGLASNYGGPLFESSDGSIWVGHDRGASRLKDGRVTAYRDGALGRSYVPFFAEDSEGVISYAFGVGLVRLRDGKSEPYRLKDGKTTESLPMPFSARRTRDGTLWLATVKGAWTLSDGELRKSWGLPESSLDMVAWIHEDDTGALWFGTWEGLYRVHGGAVAGIRAEQGLPHDRVIHILEYPTGRFWISSPRGVYRVSRRELEEVATGRRSRVQAELFDESDGMRSPEGSAAAQPAGCATRDGKLWFATTDGAVAVDPSRIRRNEIAPAVVIEDVVADGRSRGAGAPVRVDAGDVRVEVRYTAPSLRAPEKVRFKYRLEGFDPDWVDAGARRTAPYMRLPPGSYRFRVIAANDDGVWNEAGASLELTRTPRLHERPAVQAVALLIVLAGAWAGHRAPVRAHARRARQLESEVDQARDQIETLRGLLPVCAWCKNVRDDPGYWRETEAYVSRHAATEFPHGICADCRSKAGKTLRVG